MPMELHSCMLERKNESIALFGHEGCCSNLKKTFLISSNNPLCSEYFRSKPSLQAEKRRQIESNASSVIHPLSKFRIWYDIYIIFVYMFTLVCKPIDAAFAEKITPLYWSIPFYYAYWYISISVDILCYVDILVNFNTGFVVRKNKKIELRRRRIAWHYVTGPFFICDLLSSIPRNIPYLLVEDPVKFTLGILNVCVLLKFVRIISVITLLNRVEKYFQVKNTTAKFLGNSTLVTILLIHWISCMQFIVPRLTGRYFTDPNRPYEESWIYHNGIYNKTWEKKYAHAFFKGSAEMLGIRLDLYPIHTTADYFVSIITYWIGKVIILSIWVVMVVAMLNARSMELKFYEIINQLDEYMKQKQLPLNLRDKISKYYDFRFQRLFFKEQMITGLLSANLKRDVNIHVCKALIANVNLFADMSANDISRLVAKLIPEIFLPKDTIIQSGSPNESLYFISTGTVAVYSHSGKEICHLQDGAYFGQVSLVLKNQLAITTVIALEATQVYRLKKFDFEFCLFQNKAVFDKLVIQAENWLTTVHKVEDDYKKKLFQQTYSEGDKPPIEMEDLRKEEL